MHDDIRKFSMEGELGEPNVVATKERLVHFVETTMREQGFVPALDIEEQFTLDYDPVNESFTFKLTVYAVEVGRDKSWQVSGVMSGKEIPKYIPPTKSKQSQEPAK